MDGLLSFLKCHSYEGEDVVRPLKASCATKNNTFPNYFIHAFSLPRLRCVVFSNFRVFLLVRWSSGVVVKTAAPSGALALGLPVGLTGRLEALTAVQHRVVLLRAAILGASFQVTTFAQPVAFA